MPMDICAPASYEAVEVPFCHLEWLEAVGCPREEHGIDWEAGGGGGWGRGGPLPEDVSGIVCWFA